MNHQNSAGHPRRILGAEYESNCEGLCDGGPLRIAARRQTKTGGRPAGAISASLLTLALGVLVLFGGSVRAGGIVYPWRATTAIVKAGECLPVWFAADPGETVLAVTLEAAYHTIVATRAVEVGNWEYDQTSGNRYDTRVIVTVPPGTPTDRYDLVLHTTSGRIRSARGVKVVKDYASDYYILHFSDTHAFQHGYADSLQKMSAIVEMANIIGPELVFVTGDNLYRPTDDKMIQYFDGNESLGTRGLNALSAATFIVCGNHDYDMDVDTAGGNYREKSNWYNTWWGLQAYNFVYGEGRFMVINNGWDGFDPAPQIESAGSWLQAVGAGNFRLAGAHIKNRKIDALHERFGLNIALVGHNHHIASENPHILPDGPGQYVANSVRDHWEFNLFRVDGMTGRFCPVSGPTARVAVMGPAEVGGASASDKPNLTREFVRHNNGTYGSNRATITNRFGFDIYAAKIRFVMPQGGSYTVSHGTIEQAFDGALFRIVDVRADVPAGSAVSVAIRGDAEGPFRPWIRADK